MDEVGIESAQNVVLSHEVAPLGDRIWAWVIDKLVIFAWSITWIFILGISGAPEGVWAVVFFLLVLLPYFFYHLICELVLDGKSIGKIHRKIRVARMDGGKPRLGQYLLRWVLRLIDGFYLLGFVVILVNGKGQRLGDIAAGTTVVSLKPRLRLRDTLMAEVEPEHRVRFPGAIRLSDAQARMVRDVLHNTQGDRWALMEELASKVRRIVGDEGSGLKAMEFLQAVLADHVYLTGMQGAAGGPWERK
ncbi:MAG: RDD family protein [Flavobacteriales bacterium]|nr:RDD family protein [Flavobacteriales bacterium]